MAKHGGREGSAFPNPTGSPADIIAQGEQILKTILSDPNKTTNIYSHPRFGEVIDIFNSFGLGAKYDSLGKFIGFLEP
ncbi:hypothetical protein ERUR111494_05330 [Erysipelothrix urinaevulpis]|uniref:hypothetical protein n=1 Tax=Erysipelothrix urinaevulpis TaxID=2683717 RepID=UPI001357A488|nr:hypothetical protein [Erysipelothrix urinaevulpis]